jgi:hypothetical protein
MSFMAVPSLLAERSLVRRFLRCSVKATPLHQRQSKDSNRGRPIGMPAGLGRCGEDQRLVRFRSRVDLEGIMNAYALLVFDSC